MQQRRRPLVIFRSAGEAHIAPLVPMQRSALEHLPQVSVPVRSPRWKHRSRHDGIRVTGPNDAPCRVAESGAQRCGDRVQSAPSEVAIAPCRYCILNCRFGQAQPWNVVRKLGVSLPRSIQAYRYDLVIAPTIREVLVVRVSKTAYVDKQARRSPAAKAKA
jgi:hypothetical protein